MITHIKSVAVYVSDQAKALDFYTHKLGMQLASRQEMGPAGDWIELAFAASPTRLVIFPRAAMPEWQKLRPSVVLECDNVAHTCHALWAQGVQILQEPTPTAWGTFAKFADPDGNEFLLTGKS